MITGAVSRLRQRLWLAQERWWLTRPPSPDCLQARTPVFLLFTGRSGSKLLLDYYRCIPGTSFEYEILNPDFRQPRQLRWILGDQRMCFSSKDAALNYIARRLCKQPGELCAVKIQDWQLQRAGLAPVDLALAFPAARFIILYRRSLGRQAVSRAIAMQTGQWGWRTDDRRYRPFEGAVHLEPDSLKAYFASVRKFYEGLLQCDAIRERATLICYEQMVADPQKTLEQTVFRLLGRSAPELRPRHRKQAIRPLNEVVANLPEVEQLLRGPESVQEYSL